ncbi:MAG: sigma-54-dependent Fis family transcriptional regulator [Acidobacteria bacterium]|nr:MAG: sigma-54-dependent Fis family transcriptional regulator [Acidobacteriota bacterium]
MNKYEILIVDDEPANLQKLKRTFQADYTVREAKTGDEALVILRDRPIVAIVTDQRMPGISGVNLLRQARQVRPDSIRVILTGYTDVEYLMDAINQGQVHRYITKPWEPVALKEALRQEIERWELKKENERLSEQLQRANERLEKENFRLRQEIESLEPSGKQLVFKSQEMRELMRLIDRVVPTNSTVLIQGETGTGKELLARYIHDQSPRAEQPFVPVNCGAIPSDLIESAFFGHKKGSFTGAIDNRKGHFELAHQGTLYLDEIGEAPLELQVKLLRVLQDPEIMPVGAQVSRRVDVRIIASTNRVLSREVEAGRFRQDLFFRLNVFAVFVPPLRSRRDDIVALSEYFLERCRQRVNKPVPSFEPKTLALLRAYDWPGNVRELENEVERMVILCEPEQPIPDSMVSERIRLALTVGGGNSEGLKEKVAEFERGLILDALRRHGYNRSHAADDLGISRQTIIAKLKQYELEGEAGED